MSQPDWTTLEAQGTQLLRQAELGTVTWTDSGAAAMMLTFVLAGLVEVIPDSTAFGPDGVTYAVRLTDKGRATMQHVPRPRPCLYCLPRKAENCAECGHGPHPHL